MAERKTHTNPFLEYSLEVLNDIAALKNNWNCFGASAFSPALITKCKEFVAKLRVQPEIFPTAKASIQFEWELENDDYLEINLYENGPCQMYEQKADGTWKTRYIDAEKVIEEIGAKYPDFV